MFITVHILTDS